MSRGPFIARGRPRDGFWMVSLGIIFGLMACDQAPVSRGKDVAATAQSVCEPSLASFKDTVFPFVREHCAQCHDGTGNGPARGPAFAATDPTQSLALMRSLVDFSNLNQSAFVLVGGNKHCLSRGGAPDCGATHEEVLGVVKEWGTAAQASCSGFSRYMSSALTLPASLPTADQGFQTLHWDLSGFGPSFAGVFFEAEVQHFVLPSAASKGAYRLRAPRLGTTQSAVYVKGLKFAIDGVFDRRASDYLTVEETVLAQPLPSEAQAPLPFPALSPFAMVLLENQPTGDRLQVGFDALAVEAPASCKALAKFQPVLDVMAARDCYACHAGGPDHEVGTSPARERLAMNKSDADLCAAALQRLDRSAIPTSVFLSYPLRGNNGHPQIFTEAAEIGPVFSSWAKAEIGL